MNRREAIAALGSAFVAGVSPSFAQSKWPERVIKFVVPYPPGGISDALARQVGRLLEKELGQPIIIENKGGAGTNLGSNAVAKSPADGYTWLLGSTANSVNMSLFKNMQYDTARDLLPVSLLADVPNVLVVNKALPVNSVQELIDLAKKDPDNLAYASAGYGSPAHLAAEQFKRLAKISLRHVPYKGAGPAVTDVIAGHVPIIFTNLAAVFGGIDSGSLKLLGVGGSSRWPAYPNAPTIAEAGVAGYDASAWYGIMLPAGTPSAIVARIQEALAVVRKPESFEIIRKLGAVPVISSESDLKTRITGEIEDYKVLVRDAGLSVD